MVPIKRSYVLSIIFCGLSFYIYFILSQLVFSYLPQSSQMNTFALFVIFFVIFFVLIPAALVTGRKLSGFFTQASRQNSKEDI